MTVLLFVIAALLAIFGVLKLVSGDILFGVLLIIAALIVGPGGYSIFQ